MRAPLFLLCFTSLFVASSAFTIEELEELFEKKDKADAFEAVIRLTNKHYPEYVRADEIEGLVAEFRVMLVDNIVMDKRKFGKMYPLLDKKMAEMEEAQKKVKETVRLGTGRFIDRIIIRAPFPHRDPKDTINNLKLVDDYAQFVNYRYTPEIREELRINVPILFDILELRAELHEFARRKVREAAAKQKAN